MRYVYDERGRLVEIYSPYDTGSTPAVRYSYMRPAQGATGSAAYWYARTENKLLYDAADSTCIQTILSIDGLGRNLATAKQGEYRSTTGTRQYGWNLSGAIVYDSQGRTAAQGQPQFSEGSALPEPPALYKPTVTSYDAAGRQIKTTLPDGATMTTDFAVRNGLAIETATDPLGNKTEKTLDGQGNISALRRLDKNGTVLMSETYTYNEMGEILSAKDSKGNTVKAAYDNAGHRTSLSSPDTGTARYYYDDTGNLSYRTDQNLLNMGGRIDYTYDALERLVKVTYPRLEPTVYEFGDDTQTNRQKGLVGRLIRRSDDSGSVTYSYGRLGETTAMTKTLRRLAPGCDDISQTFAYESDYLGRLEKITYPDGEILTYGYDAGGQVKTAESTTINGPIVYVKDIAYDPFGQRTYIEYGNDTRTSYVYDPDRRWLSSIKTTDKLGTVYQNIQYRFDAVGNILGYTNDSGSYSTEQNYSYDGLYELVSAGGTGSYKPYGRTDYTSSYSQKFSYDPIGNMLSKTSSVLTRPEQKVGDELNYSSDYAYYAGKAHQTERIGSMYYRYDANGNMTEERFGGHSEQTVQSGDIKEIAPNVYGVNYGFGLVRRQDAGDQKDGAYTRYYVWDEENRLKATLDSRFETYYRYDADGQRTSKYSSLGESLYFDNMWQLETYSTELRQLKNIYIGETRIATQLGFDAAGTDYKKQNTYYYHSDHLGSAQLISDCQGKEYERIEYTPYGETWIEKTRDGLESLPFCFTGKELDEETGFYYYGARYLNPKTSVWISADPALGEYLPVAPLDDDARKHNQQLPGQGGVFNLVNLNLYHYAANNPIKYVDPDGNYLLIAVSLINHTMTIAYTQPGTGYPESSNPSIIIINVVTNVIKNGNCETSSIHSDDSRRQRNGTNPTQLKPGVYGIAGPDVPSANAGNTKERGYPFGKPGEGLRLDAFQMLPNKKGVLTYDSGYMIHITFYGYTNGCIGIPYDPNIKGSKEKAEEMAKGIVEMYNETIGKNGDHVVKVIIEP